MQHQPRTPAKERQLEFLHFGALQHEIRQSQTQKHLPILFLGP